MIKLFVLVCLIVAAWGVVTPTVNKPVIVIGAGMSGIATAATLFAAGIPVLVLEARNRTGGRVWSNRDLGYVAEMGASWMNGIDTNTLTPIARLINAPLFGPTPYENLQRYDLNGNAISAEDSATQQATFSENQMTAFYSALSGVTIGGQDETFDVAFNKIDPSILQDQNNNWFITTSMESDIGGPIEKTSAAYGVSGQANEGGDYLLPNGYDQILNYVATNISTFIKLNQQVTAIDYSNPNQVNVTTTSGVFTGSYVIVTVPLGVLKNNIIKFNPALPDDKQKAINSLLMGTLNKIWLKFPNNDWKGNTTFAWGLNKGVTTDTRGRFSWMLNTGLALSDPTAMLVFAMGQASVDIESITDDEVIQEIMGNLKTIFGPNVPQPTGMVRSKWNSDPYTYGCYAYAGIGATSESYAVVGQPVGTSLYFAGEHTNVNYKGYVHGAYQSGLRAANEVLTTLGAATAAPAETTSAPGAAFSNQPFITPNATTRAPNATSPATTTTTKAPQATRSNAALASISLVLLALFVILLV